ncbi:MAG TPA: glycosyltransferase family 39 protein [Gemmatimonadaceae bacterium]|nr:glycosyltransferase family 39 protein [Gemmatimonadaceae bacterium]
MRRRPAERALAPLAPGLLRAAAPPDAATRTALAVVLACALALRLPGLNAGLWFDEIQTLVSYVRLPLRDVVTTFDSQNQHLLYSLLAALSVRAFGDAAWALRLPAVLFGVASIGATYWLGRLVTARREALLAAALLAGSYHHVWFSQNARGYTGLLLFTLLGTGLFVQLLGGRAQRPRAWLAYGAVMALAHYTHTSAALVSVAHAAIWLALVLGRPREEWPVRLRDAPALALGASAAVTLLLYAPVLTQVAHTTLADTHGGAGGRWQAPSWLVSEMLRGLAAGLPGGWLTLAAGVVVTAVGVGSYARQSRALLALLLLPAVVTAAVIIGLGHNLWPRFFFFSAGFAALIVVRGVFALGAALLPARGPALATAALAAGCVASLTTVPAAWQPKQDFVGADAFVRRAVAAGDAVAALDMSGFVYTKYLPHAATLVDSGDALRALEARHRRTWVIYTFPQRLAAVQPAIWRRLERDYRPAAAFPGTVREGTVFVVVRP